LNQSGDTMLRLLDHHATTSDQLIEIAKKLFKSKDINLIMDDTLIEKMYSKAIERTSDNRDHSNGQVYRSFCSIDHHLQFLLLINQLTPLFLR
jgi:hypothetical protein